MWVAVILAIIFYQPGFGQYGNARSGQFMDSYPLPDGRRAAHQGLSATWLMRAVRVTWESRQFGPRGRRYGRSG